MSKINFLYDWDTAGIAIRLFTYRVLKKKDSEAWTVYRTIVVSLLCFHLFVRWEHRGKKRGPGLF